MSKENAKPVKKSKVTSRVVRPSYEEAKKGGSPNTTSRKDKWQDKGNIKSDKKK
jgi:hypothetical protein